jgi:hypothetical protein
MGLSVEEEFAGMVSTNVSCSLSFSPGWFSSKQQAGQHNIEDSLMASLLTG